MALGVLNGLDANHSVVVRDGELSLVNRDNSSWRVMRYIELAKVTSLVLKIIPSAGVCGSEVSQLKGLITEFKGELGSAEKFVYSWVLYFFYGLDLDAMQAKLQAVNFPDYGDLPAIPLEDFPVGALIHGEKGVEKLSNRQFAAALDKQRKVDAATTDEERDQEFDLLLRYMAQVIITLFEELPDDATNWGVSRAEALTSARSYNRALLILFSRAYRSSRSAFLYPEVKQPADPQTYMDQFYIEGTKQYEWRILHNRICEIYFAEGSAFRAEVDAINPLYGNWLKIDNGADYMGVNDGVVQETLGIRNHIFMPTAINIGAVDVT